jgi:hypothetical protein
MAGPKLGTKVPMTIPAMASTISISIRVKPLTMGLWPVRELKLLGNPCGGAFRLAAAKRRPDAGLEVKGSEGITPSY